MLALDSTYYFVECTDTEYHFLWRENESLRTLYPNLYLKWKQDDMGLSVYIGEVDYRSIMVSLRWAILDNKKVCFYYGCSDLVDNGMIRAYINKLSSTAKHTNSSNFHICRNDIKKGA